MKTLKTLLIFFAVAATAFALSGAGLAYADEGDTFSIYLPKQQNYLFLSEPTTLAANGNNVAVFDSDKNQIVVSGDVNKIIQSVSGVSDMALYQNTLVVLTKEMRLFAFDLSLDTKTEINTGEELLETPTLIAAYGDTLFAYNGHRTAVAIDFATLSVKTQYKNNLLIYGKSLSANQTTLYAFTFNGDFVAVDLLSGVAEKVGSSDADKVLALPDGYALYTKNSIRFNTSTFTGDISLPSSALKLDEIVSLTSLNNTLFATDGGNSIKEYALSENGLSFTRSLGSSGSELGMFFNPTDLEFSPSDKLAVSDLGNERVQVLSSNSKAYVGIEAKDIAWQNNALYAVTSLGKIVKLEQSSSYVDFSGVAARIAANADTLYVADNNLNLVAITSDSTTTYAKLPSAALSLTAGKAGNVVYALTKAEIAGYTSNGKLAATIDVSAYDVIDIWTDYVGNVYALNNGLQKTIIKFSRVFDSYLKTDEVVLQNSVYSLGEATALAVNGDGEFFVLSGDRHFIAKINHDFAPVLNYTAEADPSITVASSSEISYGFAVNTLIYSYTNNFEYVTPIKNSSLMIFDGYVNNDFFYIMLPNGEKGFVEKAAVQKVLPSETAFKNIKMLHPDGDNIYSYPSKSATSLRVDNTVEMKILSNAANFTGDGVYWYEVSYFQDGEEKSGFVLRTRVQQFKEEQPEPVEEIFAKVSTKIATSMSLYYLADEQSGVIASLSDGAKVQVLETIDPSKTFTLVRYDGVEGYVLTSCLTQTDGLTNGQLVGILIAVFMVVATSLFLLISKNAKRLKRN